MAALDFYFDFTSPYGYLMAERIDALAARFGREVCWRPILLGVIFQRTGGQPPIASAQKGPYLLCDVPRSARFLGIPYRHPSRFPLPTQAACRAFYHLQAHDEALAKRFAQAVYRALFLDDRDISSPETVVAIAADLGADAAALTAALETPELKARAKDESEAALARGVFGSPFVFIDDEPFFGADRLPQIERWLAEGGF